MGVGNGRGFSGDRVAGVPYATVALVTDYDAGVDGHAPVTLDEVFAVMRRNVATVRDVLAGAIATLP